MTRQTAPRRACLACLAALAHHSLVRPPPAGAVTGAAEMDAEFYVRALLDIPPKVAARDPKPPRMLEGEAATALLFAVASSVAASTGRSAGEVTAAAAAQSPRLAIELDRALTSGAFSGTGYGEAGGSLSTAPLTNEFAFDLRLYALFSLVEGSAASGTALAGLGDRLLAAVPAEAVPAVRGDSIVSAAAGCRRLLEYLRRVGYIVGFDLDADDADDALWAQRSDLSATLLRVTIYEPASLRSALLLSQHAGRRSSELAAPMLAAYLRGACGASVAWSEYFVDEYRDNPLDYRPSQLILELALTPAA